MRAALAERDSQIAELQQAVIELANTVEGPMAAASQAQSQELAALREQIASLQNRMVEQERTIRHTLTMLIEWIEAEDVQRVAA